MEVNEVDPSLGSSQDISSTTNKIVNEIKLLEKELEEIPIQLKILHNLEKGLSTSEKSAILVSWSWDIPTRRKLKIGLLPKRILWEIFFYNKERNIDEERDKKFS
jgi:hypothetical protein